MFCFCLRCDAIAIAIVLVCVCVPAKAHLEEQYEEYGMMADTMSVASTSAGPDGYYRCFIKDGTIVSLWADDSGKGKGEDKGKDKGEDKGDGDEEPPEKPEEDEPVGLSVFSLRSRLALVLGVFVLRLRFDCDIGFYLRLVRFMLFSVLFVYEPRHQRSQRTATRRPTKSSSRPRPAKRSP